MIVLGADLSYTSSGLVWLSGPGNIQVHYQARHAFAAGPYRLRRAFSSFRDVLQSYPPDLVIIEDVAVGAPSRTTVVKLSQLNAVFVLACECLDVEYLTASPSLIKKWVTGKGNAEKWQVAERIRKKLGISFKGDPGHDFSDACALAWWGMETKA